MASVTIYTKPNCPACIAARALLEEKDVHYTEVLVPDNPVAAKAMQTLTGQDTVPQIFIGEYHVGGYEDLKALDDVGALDPILAELPAY